MNWLMSANSQMYDHVSSFEHYGFIDWKQGNNKFQVGDNIYIYCTAPIKKIRYKCVVKGIDLDVTEIRDDKEYWVDLIEYEKSLSGKFMRLDLIEQIDNDKFSLKNLLNNGLNAAPQSPLKLTGNLLNYIETNFNDYNQNGIFPEMISEELAVYEGFKKSVSVNKFERSSIARAKCIEYNGTICKVCNIDLLKFYGEIALGFIHIHHLVPISKIGKEYKIDFRNDLIPVCPNCHAMLHKKINGKELSIEELKEQISKNANN
jgi:5-methylcytosine-specific restriction protein A